MHRFLTQLKELIKNALHNIPFVPYRKPSKRTKIWSEKTEREFLKAINYQYLKDLIYYNQIEVSVIMPVHNRAYCIEKAINSVLSQTHNSWNLIIVDDGSTDNLDEALKDYLDDSRISIYHKNWGGVSQARNYGLKHSKGKYIFYLDTDNTWYPDYLQRMIVYMEKGNLDACYSGTRIIDDDGKIIGYYGENFIWNESWELNYIDINCFAHRQDLLKKGFRFDETLTRLVDWDFILAITALHRTAYAPFLGVEYYDGQQGNRITFTQHLGDDIKKVIAEIQKRYQGYTNDASCSAPQIRPDWKKILQ